LPHQADDDADWQPRLGKDSASAAHARHADDFWMPLNKEFGQTLGAGS